jgi:hypothetical protein
MKRKIKFVVLILCTALLAMNSCKKKNTAAPKVPTLTTSAATNVASKGLTSGGTISSDGGLAITATGLAYSKTNQNPTIADDTTRTATLSGEFVSELKNLDPSATYYIRAYAINNVGTGYGNTITVTLGNAAPEAKNVAITGEAKVNALLTATYTYFDFEGNPESGTSFQWYKANDATGAGETPIAGANLNTYKILTNDEGKYIRVGVTPKSSGGTITGAEAKSSFTAEIGDNPSVTFTYNNQTVTYSIITSLTTGRKWLDRNLGAANTPIAFDDWANYGDLFQWGRRADGHQLVIRTEAGVIEDANGFPLSPSGASVIGTPYPWDPNPVNNPGWVDNDLPPHSKFILVGTGFYGNTPWDWRKPQNDNLWQGVNGVNNPCPTGWRLPTKDEFAAENIIDITDAYNKIKLSRTHSRNSNSEFIGHLIGRYWTSTTADAPIYAGRQSYFLRIGEPFQTTVVIGAGGERAAANAVRCIKD